MENGVNIVESCDESDDDPLLEKMIIFTWSWRIIIGKHGVQLTFFTYFLGFASLCFRAQINSTNLTVNLFTSQWLESFQFAVCSLTISSRVCRMSSKVLGSMLTNLHSWASRSLVDLLLNLVRPSMAVAMHDAAMEDGGSMEKRKSVERKRKRRNVERGDEMQNGPGAMLWGSGSVLHVKVVKQVQTVD